MRLLIAAGAAAESYEHLPESVRGLIESADDVTVISPELPSRTHWLASDTDRARMAADERLGAVLSHLEESGKAPRGVVGADDPLLAFEDAIGEMEPDHILIALRSSERAGWQERELIDQVLVRFGLPITVFTL
jgi:hypothetical protein